MNETLLLRTVGSTPERALYLADEYGNVTGLTSSALRFSRIELESRRVWMDGFHAVPVDDAGARCPVLIEPVPRARDAGLGWRILRWGGRRTDTYRPERLGTLGKKDALDRWTRLATQLRQGTVALFDPDGNCSALEVKPPFGHRS